MKTLAKGAAVGNAFLDEGRALAAPGWIKATFRLTEEQTDGDVRIMSGADAMLISVRVQGAVWLDSPSFERATSEAYAKVWESVRGMHPVRFWNHIPAIHAVMDAERDRYMVFNAGRFHAFENWYGSADAFSRYVATASGVGHSGSDLVIHCLATREPGVAVENPRQIAAYKYSRRYGPLPPCFARATKVKHAEEELLLVGGTASICGEDSVHVESVSLQLDETFENLATLVDASRPSPLPFPSRSAGTPYGRGENAPPTSQAGLEVALSHYRYLRVYYRHNRDVRQITDAVTNAMPRLLSVEYIQAELCRQELLAEIEGLAHL
ncbi:MAG TPA: hypothetical protein VF669_16175 [Tepidisphaeraceae bacterium]|jgi:hypothetical protein